MFFCPLSVFQNGSIKSDNIKATYDGTKWTLAGTHKYSPKYQYFAYYPYTTSGLGHVTGTVASGTTATTFFASGISAFTPATNQSTVANFNASDLQVAKGTISRTDASDVTFSLERQMNLVQLSSAGSQEIFVADDATQTSTDGIPYTVSPYSSGSNYCAIVKSPSGKTAAVTYEYVLALKDIFYTDGSLSHYSASLLSGKTPVAIIFKIGTTTADAALGYTHGYGIALKSAGSSIQWYYDTTTDQPALQNWETILKNATHAASDYETLIRNDYNGLTQYNALKDNASSTDAFGAVRSFGERNSIKRGVWFLPSEGQLYDAIDVLSDYDIANHTVSIMEPNHGVYYPDGQQLINKHAYLSEKFSSEYYDPILPLITDYENRFIWSSSEFNSTHAMKFNIENFEQYHNFYFSGDHAKYENFTGWCVRACMAF